MSGSDSGVGANVTQVEGLFLRGRVVRRTRRSVLRKDGRTTDVIRFFIGVGDRVEPYEVWEPEHIHAVGETVDLPVTVRPYRTRCGTGYTLGPPRAEEAF